METRKIVSVFFWCVGITMSFAQRANYIKTTNFNTIDDLENGAVQNYFYDIQKSGNTYNDKMLNILFASEVSSYVGDSKDLTLQQAYAILKTSDNTLFLGGSFDFRGEDKTTKLSHLLTTGIKAKVKDGFANFFKNGDLQNDMGINLKYHFIGRGIIYFDDKEEEIKNYREKILMSKYQEKVEEYAKNVYPKEKEVIDSSFSNNQQKNERIQSLLSKKAAEIYEDLVEEEIKHIRKFKIYNMLWDWWFSSEVFLPVSKSEYNIIGDISTTDIQPESYFPWKIIAGGTSYWKWSNGKSLYISGFGEVKNNNNIETEILNEYELPVASPVNPDLIEDTEIVYVGDFNSFVTSTLNAEIVSFLFSEGRFGLSAGIEKNFGEYNALNWKLGIPFSLRDKEGKPTVNFELQWKEVNKNHFVGLSIGFTFGKFIQ